jgi:2-haloacid dehalogenase
MNHFLNTICSWEWNENQDAGYSLQKATEERVAMYPEYERLIRMYYGRWEDMLGYEHTDTVELLKTFKNRNNYRLIGLTNWSHETFPVALERFAFLSWFEGVVVSGTEKMKKPDTNIYTLTLDRYKIIPENAVFIDDKLENVHAATQLGMHGIHFTSAAKLKRNLETLGVS